MGRSMPAAGQPVSGDASEGKPVRAGPQPYVSCMGEPGYLLRREYPICRRGRGCGCALRSATRSSGQRPSSCEEHDHAPHRRHLRLDPVIRRLLPAVVVIAGGIAMPMATSSARAADSYEGPCVDNVGVTVVVDFQELGGGVNVRCAPGPVTSGLDALDKAGILWEGRASSPGSCAGSPGYRGPTVRRAGDTTGYCLLDVLGGAAAATGATAALVRPAQAAAGFDRGWSFALDKVAVDVPPPRFTPPAPIPGQPPNPIKGSDCGGAARLADNHHHRSSAPNTPPQRPPRPRWPRGTPQDAPQPATATTAGAARARQRPPLPRALRRVMPRRPVQHRRAPPRSPQPTARRRRRHCRAIRQRLTPPYHSARSISATISAAAAGSAATVGGLGIAAGLAGAGAWVARRRRGMP